jgi:membrane protein insertase Oxa1/YidC/SpoIIIJ
LPIITIVLFLVQQKMFMPPPTDEQTRMQQQMMKYMMVFMGVLFFRVPSGLCVYFIASSLWGIAERKMLPPPQKQEKRAAELVRAGSSRWIGGVPHRLAGRRHDTTAVYVIASAGSVLVHDAISRTAGRTAVQSNETCWCTSIRRLADPLWRTCERSSRGPKSPRTNGASISERY